MRSHNAKTLAPSHGISGMPVNGNYHLISAPILPYYTPPCSPRTPPYSSLLPLAPSPGAERQS